jgi:hypothetical protein
MTNGDVLPQHPPEKEQKEIQSHKAFHKEQTVFILNSS